MTSIYWQPIKGRALAVGHPSSFFQAIGGPDGDDEFSVDHLEFLRGLAAGNEAFREGCEELISAIQKHGRVRVWAES